MVPFLLSSPALPPKVYSSEMKRKLDKISALAKGFLTRRLLQTEKLKHLRQTVKVRGHLSALVQGLD